MIIFRTGQGVGDVLLATGVLRAWKRQHSGRVIVETHYPEIFENNLDVWKTWQEGNLVMFIQKTFNHRGIWRIGNICLKAYDHFIHKPTYPFPCRGKHLIDAMAETIGVEMLPEERRPFLYLTPAELAEQSWARNWIAVQSSSSSYWTVNKNWVPGRMQSVVDELKHMGYQLVQLGSEEDERLSGIKDLRGKTSLREAGAILANAKLLVGLEGGMVHLARAVNSSSVVIYTHYTLPEETGYIQNVNLRDVHITEESCWKKEKCEVCETSSSNISPEDVLSACEIVLNVDKI